MVSENDGVGRDALGRDLEITIRIGPDGTVHFHDLTADMLPVAQALAPGDPVLSLRAERAAAYREDPRP